MLLALSLSLILIYYNEYRVVKRIEKHVKDVYIHRYVDRKVCSELDYVDITISIENRSSIEFPRIVVIDFPPQFIALEKGRPIFTIALPPRKTVNIRYRVKVYAPGSHDFDKVVLYFSDPLNYFYETYEYSVRESIVALPLYIPIKFSMKSLQKIIGVHISGKAVGGLYDLATFRDYSPGDDVRKILWKYYARSGRLVVREDYGESRARVLMLIDMKPHLWRIGKVPNTLAQIQLRFTRSLIHYLSRSSCRIDVSICSGIVPKVYRDVEKNIDESLYTMMSILESGGGCISNLDIFSEIVNYIDSVDSYDIVIMVTNPLSLVTDHPENLQKVMNVFGNRVFIAMPMYRYEEYVDKKHFEKLISIVSEIAEKYGVGLEVSEENFYVEV